jgi:opacity protein-like surface antigen
MGASLPIGTSPYKINRDKDLPTGSGHYGVTLGINMSKPIDPAMLFGSIGLGYSLKRDNLSQNNNGAILKNVEPGVSYSAAIGLAYSISYALSMNVSFNYGYATSTNYRFANAKDSRTPAYSTGSLGIGIGWRVSPLTTLSLGLSIGLTNNNPDFGLSFRVPLSF